MSGKVCVWVIVALCAVGSAEAQSGPTTRSRLDAIMTSALDTPGGQALLAVALADAQVALDEALDAVAAGDDASAVQRHARRILHALDPARQPEGPDPALGSCVP